MEASAFRIGNYAKDPCLGIIKITHLSIDMRPNVYQPVLLTREIFTTKIPQVERQQTEKNAEVYYIWKYRFSINTIGLVRFHFSGKVLYLRNVHQLQNLYFAITGEELIINL